MNILFYSPVRLKNGGGCERWHCDIANSFRKQFGDNVEIVTGNLGDDKWSDDYLSGQLLGIPYICLHFPIIGGILVPTPSVMLALYRKIRSADVIHFIYGFAGQDLMMLFLKLLTGKRIVVGHHAPTFHASEFHNVYMKYFSRYLMNFFDAHQTLNSSDQKYLRGKWNINNVYFIPSGIRVERFLKIKRKPHSKLNFLCVGRYELQKGYDLLVEAIKLFNKKFPENNSNFYFVGGGSLKPVIQNAAKTEKNIIDLGYVEYEKIPEIYASSDVFLLPSREEPFGLVLIEAWAAGIPVLATATEGPVDMLEPEKNGWFIKSPSVKSIIDQLSEIYLKWSKDSHGLLKLAKNCRKTAVEYGIDRTAKSMRKLFIKKT